jgi:tetratricopeptide (TPR) repeat protein
MPADLPDEPAAPASGPLPSLAEEAVSAPDPMPEHYGWSDSSLASMEDFSSVLFAMNAAMRFTTSDSLDSGMLADAGVAQEAAPSHDSGALYSNAVPVVRDTGPHYVSADTGVDTMLPSDPTSWTEASYAEEWQAAPSNEMPIVEAPAPESLMPTPAAEMQAPMQIGEAQSEETEGRFSAESMEFEPFMFNGGAPGGMPELPHMGEFMPAVTGMESAFAPDQPAPPMQSEALESSGDATQAMDNDALPFWLQNTGDLTSQQAMTYLPAMGDMGVQQGSPAHAMPGMEAAPVMEEMQPQEIDDLNLYADLPPIDPFDFTALDVHVQEESLGFNTAELSGFASSNYDPMVATADLQVVASILGTDPDLMMDSAPLRPSMAGGETTPVAEAPEPAAFAQPDAPQSDEQTTPTPTMQQLDASPRSWTATVTSNLSMESLPGAQSDSVSLADDNYDVADGDGLDVDIAPFDFSNLDLEAEEKATGLLTMPRVKNTGPLNAIAAADMPYSAPEQPDYGQPETQAAQPKQPQANGRRWATGWLGDSGAEVTSDLPRSTSKKKKAQDAEPEQEAPTAYESLETQPTEVMAVSEPVMETQAEEAPTAYEMVGSQPEEALAADEPWEAQPEGAMASTFEPEQEVYTDDGPMLADMRDENLKTGSLVLPGDEDEEVDSADMAEMSHEAYFMPADAEVMQGPFAAQDEAETASYVADEPQDGYMMDGVASEWAEPEPAQAMDYAPVTPEEAQPEQVWSSTPQQATVVTTHPNTYQPAQPYTQAQESEYNPGVKFPTSVLASGPLPSLDGFEELLALVAANPTDVGAHMALASAYAQVGDIDTQLRVYRRVLKKPGVSNKILRLIAEELSDYEADLTGHPHFHQVRGDLYMKQNRFQEAIEEYNKIG